MIQYIIFRKIRAAPENGGFSVAALPCGWKKYWRSAASY
jgi:hypothetical protein